MSREDWIFSTLDTFIVWVVAFFYGGAALVAFGILIGDGYRGAWFVGGGILGILVREWLRSRRTRKLRRMWGELVD